MAHFPLIRADYLHGDVVLLQQSIWSLQYVDPLNPAPGLEQLFRVLPLHETRDGTQPFACKSHTWRTLARVAAANTRVPREHLAVKQVADTAIAVLIGEYVPHVSTMRQPYDGFRAVAVAMSLYLGYLITPRRAAACFHRPKNQEFELTAYGRSLFGRFQMCWPPHPECEVLLV